MILSRDTIKALTERVRYKAQVRRLREMGIPIKALRPDGSPVVLQTHLMDGHPEPSRPRVRDA